LLNPVIDNDDTILIFFYVRHWWENYLETQ
jgi:hypothetical protein